MLLPSEGLITFSGSGSGAASESWFSVLFEMEVQVPEIGDAIVPVYITIDDLVETGSNWSVRQIAVFPRRHSSGPVCTYAREAGFDSLFLGSPLGPQIESTITLYARSEFVVPGPARRTTPIQLIAGDTVVIPLEVSIGVAFAGSSGSFSDSVRIAFRTAPTTIGNGDVNGDAQVNVLDTTLIRRAIAGAPNP
jgi:hypothetical protein